MKRITCALFALFCAIAPLAGQDPDIEADEQAAIDAVYRSSDEPGETPTGFGARRGGRKRVSVPKGATRVGCVCMDETHSATHSSGACSGHGGVRYWHYKTVEGDTVRVLTERHERHPHPLTDAEKSELVQPKPKAVRRGVAEAAALAPSVVVMQPAPAFPPVNYAPLDVDGDFTWSQTTAVAIAGIALYTSLRYVLAWLERNPNLTRYALRHLLRYRKRPTARKNRPNPPAPLD